MTAISIIMFLQKYQLDKKPLLKDRLDNDEIAIRTTVSLSYLRIEEQEVVAQLLQSDKRIV